MNRFFARLWVYGFVILVFATVVYAVFIAIKKIIEHWEFSLGYVVVFALLALGFWRGTKTLGKR
jgi:hypothetical protein